MGIRIGSAYCEPLSASGNLRVIAGIGEINKKAGAGYLTPRQSLGQPSAHGKIRLFWKSPTSGHVSRLVADNRPIQPAWPGNLRKLARPYFFLTIGQNSGFYCSPNKTYDDLVGINPSRCSRRDLVVDLAKALSVRGIRLLVYLPSAAPVNDAVAREKLGSPRDDRMSMFQLRWEAVIREWSLRWGRSVNGWWIDGLYNKEQYEHPDAPNYRSFAEALKAGNPDAIVAFNNALRTPLYSVTEYEDYTPGEIDRDLTVALGHSTDPARLMPYHRHLDGAQLHVLTIMGEWWGKGPVRFPDELTIGYTKFMNTRGGVVTWDVPLTTAGLIEEEFLPQLTALGRAISPKS